MRKSRKFKTIDDFKPEVKEEMLKLYKEQHKSANYISKQFGPSVPTILRFIRMSVPDAQFPKHKTALSKEEFLQKFDATKSMIANEELTGMSSVTIRNYCKRFLGKSFYLLKPAKPQKEKAVEKMVEDHIPTPTPIESQP